MNILEMNDEQLAVKAAELFTPEGERNHKDTTKDYGCTYQCQKCDDERDFDGWYKKASCPHPDPLDVTDWNVAMRLFRKAWNVNTNRDELINIIILVGKAEDWTSTKYYLLFVATPQDYIKAACLAKGD